MAALDQLSAFQIAAGVAAGDFSAVEVARAALDTVAAREPDVQAFLQVTAEQAFKLAAATDAARASHDQKSGNVFDLTDRNAMGRRTGSAPLQAHERIEAHGEAGRQAGYGADGQEDARHVCGALGRVVPDDKRLAAD